MSVTFSVKFPDSSTGKGLQASPVEVAIYDSRNQIIETLVYPTSITETDLGGGDYEYSVIAYDTTDIDSDFISVVWTGTTLAAGVIYQLGYNVAITPTLVLPTYDNFEGPYTELSYANEFFGLGLDDDCWNEFGDVDKQKALFTASNQIDELYYHGRKYFTSGVVKRQFPRILPAMYFEFTNIDEVGIPEDVKKACAIQALHLLQEKRDRGNSRARMNLQSQGVTGVSRLQSSEQWDLTNRRRHQIIPEAYALLKTFILRGGASGGEGGGFL